MSEIDEVPEELVRCWKLLGRAIPLIQILNENEQAKEWLADMKIYMDEE